MRVGIRWRRRYITVLCLGFRLGAIFVYKGDFSNNRQLLRGPSPLAGSGHRINPGRSNTLTSEFAGTQFGSFQLRVRGLGRIYSAQILTCVTAIGRRLHTHPNGRPECFPGGFPLAPRHRYYGIISAMRNGNYIHITSIENRTKDRTKWGAPPTSLVLKYMESLRYA